MKILCSFIFLFLIITTSYGQTTYKKITGKIVSEKGEPVSYATVSLRGGGINTMSNINGEFVFKIPGSTRGDSIYISHVGYEQFIWFANITDTAAKLISMQAKVPEMAATTVTAVNALNIVKQAIARIPQNYPTTPFLITGFHRLTGRKEQNIVHMSEAVFDIFNDGYTRRNKQVRLIKSRFDKDLTAFNGNNSFNFGTSPEDVSDYDIVGNVNESDLLNRKAINDYKFTYKGIVDHDGAEAYQIAFDQKDGIKKSLKQGTIIIDIGTLAFLEFNFRLSPKGIKYWSLGFPKKMLLNLSRIRIDLLQDSTLISYRKYGNKYYLNHVKGTSLWHIRGGKDHFELNPFRLHNIFLSTGIDTINAKPFKNSEVFAEKQFLEKPFSKQSSNDVDSFWREYNLILPEFNVDSVANVIQKHNESLNYKVDLETRLRNIRGDRPLRIDSIFGFYHRLAKFNGTAIVQYKGDVIYAKSFGLADRSKQTKNSNLTQFRIGSASKQFTSMLIMQLINEGRLSVDDSIGKFLPGFVHGKVTIAQLMTHQSGIPNYTNNEAYLAQTVVKPYSLSELVRRFCSDSLEFEPGTQFHYSNSGYVVLALLIEKITGASFAATLKTRIFDPLGMENSYFGSDPTLATNLATGYVNDEPELDYAVGNITGAGGITSTAEDLLKWNNALTASVLLPASQTKEMFKARVEWKEWGADYGYGWMIDRLSFQASASHKIEFHPGTEPGFHSMIIRQPDKGIVIILLNNAGEFPRFEIADLILQECNG